MSNRILNEPSSADVFYSAGFAVYPKLGQIKVDDETLTLGPVNMKVLMLLLHNQGEIVTRSQFDEEVWVNQIVSDDALTRCISDLRNQLGQYKNASKLIETLPKRGYRWLSEVSEKQVVLQGAPLWKQYLSWGLVSVVLLMAISTALLWYLGKQDNTQYIQIALLPIQANSSDQQILATELEDLLNEAVLRTDYLRFLSRSAMADRVQNPYPYLSRELGAQWVIEGSVRQQGSGFRVSLNLVDARTALVSYTTREDFSTDEVDFTKLETEFIEGVSELLREPR